MAFFCTLLPNSVESQFTTPHFINSTYTADFLFDTKRKQFNIAYFERIYIDNRKWMLRTLTEAWLVNSKQWDFLRLKPPRLFVLLESLDVVPVKKITLIGNSSIEAAVNWIIDHEKDAYTDEMPMVQVDIIETPTPTFDSEQAKLKAQELRERARKRREEEEKKLEKKREKERIHAGKELLAAKRMTQENETRCFEAQRKTEKEEERRATERICQKLQQDMAERRAKLGSSLNSFTSSKSVKTSEQETKNPLEVESAALSGNLATKKEVLMECLRSLRRQHKEEDAKVQRAFKTLLVYVRNIVSNPDEGKFRKIRLSNPAFQAKIGIFKEGVQFLELSGFERVERGDFLVLHRDKVDMKILRSAGRVLHSAITNPFFGLLSK